MIYLVLRKDSEGEVLVGACGTVKEADEMILRDLAEILTAISKASQNRDKEALLKKASETFGGYSVVSSG